MSPAVTPILQPDAAAMLRQLQHLIEGDLDGAHDGTIELAWMRLTATSWRPIMCR